MGTLRDWWTYNTVSNTWSIVLYPAFGPQSIANQQPVGTPGSFNNAANHPGGRESAVAQYIPTSMAPNTGFVANPSVLLFGGKTNTGFRNDVWRLDTVTALWSFVSGSATDNAPGVYTSGILTPGARFLHNSWLYVAADFATHYQFVVFGGFGYDGAGNADLLNDLWQYDVISGTWTWLKGSDRGGQKGAYGTLGVLSDTNRPGARGGQSWAEIDTINKYLYVFGGRGIDSAGGGFGSLNDLWQYSIPDNDWTWIDGSNLGNKPGTYGVKGVPGCANTPGGRFFSAEWEAPGKFYVFGDGGNNFADTAPGPYNDMWMGQWATFGLSDISVSPTTATPGQICTVQWTVNITILPLVYKAIVSVSGGVTVSSDFTTNTGTLQIPAPNTSGQHSVTVTVLSGMNSDCMDTKKTTLTVSAAPDVSTLSPHLTYIPYALIAELALYLGVLVLFLFDVFSTN